MTQRQYLFEITKCCEYSEFVPTYKTATLADLYKTVLNQICHTGETPVELYTRQNNIVERLVIPNDPAILLRDFINMNHLFFVPIYPLPVTVVYRVYFDDGHIHTHDT
jgi:hypothetical protein